MKALGTGTRGVRWRDIEVVRYPGRAPTIRLHGSAQRRAERIGLDHLTLSLSHSREYAVASERPRLRREGRRIPTSLLAHLPKRHKDEAQIPHLIPFRFDYALIERSWAGIQSPAVASVHGRLFQPQPP